MSHVLVVEAEGVRTVIPVASAATAGGSLADGVRLSGLAPAALRLEPCPAGVVLTPAVAGLRVAGHPVAPGTRRLLRAGERAEVGGLALRLDGAGLDGTRAAAGALLAGAVHAGPSLVVLTGPAAGARAPLRGTVVLGRGRRARLRLPDPQVSRRHARVRLRGGRAVVEDLGSKNGLRVNGVRVERRPVALAPGDVLALGGTAVALEDPAFAPAPPPAVAPTRRLRPLAAAAVLLALSAAALLVAGW
jgi:hypothetical protein